MENIHIEWSEAIQEKKLIEKENARRKQEYQEQIDDAHEEVWDALGNEDFRYSDFEDICYGHGVDQDDIIDLLI